jgi:hypothetical protein
LAGPIDPGTRLTLELDIEAQESFRRCGVLIQVVRSDGLVMFTGMSTLDGMPELEMKPQEHVRGHISFVANVLRGTYIINIQLVDTMRQWAPAIISGVKSFVVTETTRAAGCAELLPRYELGVVAPSAAPLAPAGI